MSNTQKGTSIVLCGSAGQGIRTIENILVRLFKSAGLHVFSTKEYMSRVRGGLNSTTIRVADKPVSAPHTKIDILVPLNKGAVSHLSDRLDNETLILGETEVLDSDTSQSQNFLKVPFSEIAENIGNKIYSNTVAGGAIAGILGIEKQTIEKSIADFFAKKEKQIVDQNVQACIKGLETARKFKNKTSLSLGNPDPQKLNNRIITQGAHAVCLGAIAAGCNFISAYPMSPSTAIITYLSQKADKFGIVAEQAEDEIAAINMAIGAWYAGARAMVATSGGGFALMTEGLSLAGITESPLVTVIAQRPGPATGLPTRTEQGDLELALYAGHGNFPRIILAPGTLQQGFQLTKKAFQLADKYQLPVIILTDQYYMDTNYDTEPFTIDKTNIKKYITPSKSDYKRYQFTDNGISPRAIPGYGDGLVCIDSDEHDQTGHITENMQTRTDMMDKRMTKGETLKQDSIQPEIVGPKDYTNLVICWGSNYPIVKEAIQNIENQNIAMLHFSQLYPLSEKTPEYIKKANKTIIVENNATGQLAKLIKLTFGIDITQQILKYNGLAFCVEELTEKITSSLKGK